MDFPPAPAGAWRRPGPRTLERRDGEVIVLERLAGDFVDLVVRVVDGATGAPASPGVVELAPLAGTTRDWSYHPSRPDLARFNMRFDLMLAGPRRLPIHMRSAWTE